MAPNVKLVFGNQRPFAVIDSTDKDGKQSQKIVPGFDKDLIPISTVQTIRIPKNDGNQAKINIHSSQELHDNCQLIPALPEQSLDIEVDLKKNKVILLNLDRNHSENKEIIIIEDTIQKNKQMDERFVWITALKN